MEWIVKPRSTPGDGGGCSTKGCVGYDSCVYVHKPCVHGENPCVIRIH